jgi:hypothetical protein
MSYLPKIMLIVDKRMGLKMGTKRGRIKFDLKGDKYSLLFEVGDGSTIFGLVIAQE